MRFFYFPIFREMKKLELLIPPPVVTLLMGLLMVGMDRLLPFLKIRFGAQQLIGSAFILLALLFGALALSEFYRRATSISPARPTKASYLVTDGVYSISRNPMYLGLLMALFGWFVYLGNVASFLGPVFFVYYINRFQIKPEERILLEKFNEVFTDYTYRVKRWFGRKNDYFYRKKERT